MFNNTRIKRSYLNKPTDNPFIESFNGCFHQELLNQHQFLSSEDTQFKIEEWRKDYNENSPHSSLGDMSLRELASSLEEECVC